MGLRMKNFNIMGFTEKSYVQGEKRGGHKKPIYREELPKKGGVFGQFADLRGPWRKRRDGVFEGGWYPVHTMLTNLSKKFDMSGKLFYKQPLKGVPQWSS